MITDEKMMLEELERHQREIYAFIDDLDINEDRKINLKDRWVTFKDGVRLKWKCSHPRKYDD